jgi:hypothetical protein
MKQTTKKILPFRQLELQLMLEQVDEKWEKAKQEHDVKYTADSADEMLRLSLEKIKILSEIYEIIYKA